MRDEFRMIRHQKRMVKRMKTERGKRGRARRDDVDTTLDSRGQLEGNPNDKQVWKMAIRRRQQP